jgi:hypothetical protein
VVAGRARSGGERKLGPGVPFHVSTHSCGFATATLITVMETGPATAALSSVFRLF